MAEDGQRTCSRAILFVRAVLKNVLHQVQVLPHHYILATTAAMNAVIRFVF